MQDTVFVPVATFSDSLRAILGSISAQVADSLRAVLGSLSVHVPDTLRIALPPEGWSIATWIALAALIVSGVFSFLLFRLQRAQNQMVERHERERRELDERIRTQQAGATDKRIGWTAFKLARQLRSWLDEPVAHTGGLLPGAVVNEVRDCAPDEDKLWAVHGWAHQRCAPPGLDEAETRAEALIDNAPAASERVGRKAVEAFRLFHEATEGLNKGLLYYSYQDWDIALRSFVTGHDALLVCVERLTELIPQDLQDQFVLLKGIPSTLRTYAPTVSTDPPPSTQRPDQ